MREGWKQVKIGDLGKVVTGNTPPKKDPDNYGNEYPFIKPTDMELDKRHVTSWDENYSEKAFKRYKNSYIPPKATGVVTIGTVGEKIFQADRWCFTNQSVNVVIPNNDYDDDFIYYLLKINLPKVENANPGTASGRHHVSKSNFCAIKVNVPISKETQQQIASILSAYDDLIESNLRRIALLEEQAQQNYEEWFVRLKFPGYEDVAMDAVSGLPEGWELGRLSDLINFQSGFAYKSVQFKNEGFPVIKIKNIENNTVETSNTNFINEEYASKTEKFKLNPGDLLIAMTGATVGKVGIVPITKKPCYLNQRVGRFLPLNEVDNTAFINCFFNIGNGLNHVLNIAGGAAQPNISGGQILAIETVIPKIEILKKFSEYAVSASNLKLNYQYQNRLLKEARDILLPRLMSGMIKVDDLQSQDRDYEMSEAPLGRVAEIEDYYKKH